MEKFLTDLEEKNIQNVCSKNVIPSPSLLNDITFLKFSLYNLFIENIACFCLQAYSCSSSFQFQPAQELHWYHRDQGWNLSKPEFFQAFFSQLHKLCI